MKQSREIKNFIFSQYFSDGLRITFGVLFPSLIFYHFNQIEIGVTISLGAVCVSIVDNPGPVVHKRNAMLFCSLAVFLTAVLTGLINNHPILLGFEIVVLSFFYSMFSVYGVRVSAIGTAALLIMIFSIDQLSVFGTFEHAFYVLVGGLWYLILSLSVSQIRPYRQAQQVLGECIKEVARYVRIKANFYNLEVEVEKNYKDLIDQQVIVHNQQDSVREILFKSRMLMKDSTTTGRLLILTFVDIVDLFEQAMATYYDYETIRNQFGKTGILKDFKITVDKIADELEDCSYIITGNFATAKMHDLQNGLEKLKIEIDLVETRSKLNNLVLKKILINVRNMVGRTQKIYSYFNPKTLAQEEIRSKSDLSKFVSNQEYDLKIFKSNLNLDSGIFRHSVRVAIVMLIGFLVSKLFPFGHHSYWILLTILVILKPGFTLTKQRNYQRLIGTVVGGVAGALLLILIKDQTALFVLLLIFMVGTYSFQRLNYVVSVLFMTPFVLILFHFLGGNDSFQIAQERIADTFTGSAIALAASYFILPRWEYQQLKSSMHQVLTANYHYLMNAAKILTRKDWDVTAYKLSRKSVYVSSANIGSTFQRMLSEPKSKQKNAKELHKFVVLNHILTSYTATLIFTLQQREIAEANPEQLKLLRKSLYHLHEAIQQLDQVGVPEFKEFELMLHNRNSNEVSDYDSKLLSEQLDLVKTTTADILKISKSLAFSN